MLIKENLVKENSSTLLKTINNLNKTELTRKNLKDKKQIQEEAFLTYLEHREKQHHLKQKKMNQYLTHQKNLKHIREGGVKSELQQEKKKYNIQFQHQYTSMMMSQKREKQEKHIKQNEKIKKKREHMKSLRDKQTLQTKYIGEL